MLRPVRMKRLRVLTLGRYKYPLLRALHEQGIVQPIDSTEKLISPEWAELVEAHPSDPSIRRIVSQVMSLNRIIELFNSVSPLPEDSMLKMAFNPSPPRKIKVEKVDGPQLLDKADKILEKVTPLISGPDERLKQRTSEIGTLSSKIQMLERIRPFKVDLADVGETEMLSVQLGITSKEKVEEIFRKIAEVTNGVGYFGSQDISETEASIVVACLSAQAKEVSDSLRKIGFERLDVSGLRGTPGESISELSNRVSDLKKEEENAKSEITALAGQWRDSLEAQREMLIIERGRIETQTNFLKTGESFIFEGWLPHKSADAVREVVTQVTDGHVVIEFSDPDVAPEDVPVILDNPPFIRHFEQLVNLYGRPKYNEFDPTIIMAPFYLFFFAAMLTDAVYGLVIATLSFLLFRGIGKYSNTFRDFSIIGMGMGLTTVLLGGTTGGFLGDFFYGYLGIDAFGPILFDSLVDVKLFLALALGVGIIHMNIGLVLGAWKNIEQKKYKDAIGVQIWLFPAQIGILLLMLGIENLGWALFLVGIAMEVVTMKAFAYFSMTGFFGDFLSYARLLATGLATTGLAVTVNVLSSMISGIPYLGFVLGAIVFVFGHIINMTINSLGGFVHGVRLHYIEMFNKFYEGGGAEYRPLRIERELTMD